MGAKNPMRKIKINQKDLFTTLLSISAVKHDDVVNNSRL